MKQSLRYQIAATFFEGLKAAPAFGAQAGPPARPAATLKRNPRGPSPPQDGPRVLQFEERADSPVGTSSLQSKRVLAFLLVSINREADAEAGADADYVAAAEAVRDLYSTVFSLLKNLGGQLVALREQQVGFSVDDVNVDGAVVEGAWEVEYMEPKPAR